MITSSFLREQGECFAKAFASGDLEITRPFYHPEVVYLSPTVRLFGWPQRIEGIDRTLEFIGLTIENLEDVRYRAVETAISPQTTSAFVRVHFDWTMEKQRVRSNYVVIYRYRKALIAQQEIYYDPSGRLEVLSDSPNDSER